MFQTQTNDTAPALFRGLNTPPEEFKVKFKPANEGEAPHVITWYGIASATVSRDVATGFAKAPGGSPGGGLLIKIICPIAYDISKFSCYPGEREIMFPPGSKFEPMSLSWNAPEKFYESVLKQILLSDAGNALAAPTIFPPKTAPALVALPPPSTIPGIGVSQKKAPPRPTKVAPPPPTKAAPPPPIAQKTPSPLTPAQVGTPPLPLASEKELKEMTVEEVGKWLTSKRDLSDLVKFLQTIN